MATNKRRVPVPVPPNLATIADPATRQAMKALIDGWQVRNGWSGDGDEKFLTKADLEDYMFNPVSGAMRRAFTGAGEDDGRDGSKEFQDLIDSILQTWLWRYLNERITILNKPQGVLDLLAYLDEWLKGLDFSLTETIEWLGEVDTWLGEVDTWLGEVDTWLGQVENGLNEEIIERIEADEVLTQQTITLGARIDNNIAAIEIERTARVTQDEALASQITTLGATVNGNTAAIRLEEEVRATVDSALATSISQLGVRVDGNVAAIKKEETARIDADGALASSVTSLGVRVDGNLAAIQTEETARIDADGALASSISNLGVRVDGNVAGILNEQQARIDADGALASNITNLAAKVTNNTALIATEQTTRANADSALATDLSLVATQTNTNTAAIQTEVTARTTADSSLSTQITTLGTNTNNALSGVQTTLASQATDISANAASYTTLAARMTTAEGDIVTAEAGLVNEANVRASTDSSISSLVNSHYSEHSGKISLLQTTSNTLTNTTQSLSNQTTTLQSRLDNVKNPDGSPTAVSLEQRMQTLVNTDGTLSAQYTVKIDVNGHVAGFGLANTPSGEGGAQSDFIVRADRFSVGGTGVTARPPFVIDTLSGRTYIDDAFINYAEIDFVKITDGVADHLTINDLSGDVNTIVPISQGMSALIIRDQWTLLSTYVVTGNPLGQTPFANINVRAYIPGGADGNYARVVITDTFGNALADQESVSYTNEISSATVFACGYWRITGDFTVTVYGKTWARNGTVQHIGGLVGGLR